MTRTLRYLLAAAAIAFCALPALARDLALVLGTESYERLERLPRGAEVTAATAGIAALGFEVVSLRNGRADSTAETLAAFMEAVPDADRILVALSGRFATDGRRTWLLTAETGTPGILSLGAEAVSVESILAVLGRAPGRALLLLGAAPGTQTVFDPWLREGIGTLDIPQGVTVLTGEPRHVADFMRNELARPEADLARLVAQNDRIMGSGFLPQHFVFMPPMPAAPVRPTEPPPVDPAVEDALWNRVRQQDNVEAYRGYLRQFPDGRYAAEAESAISAILAEPFRDARLAEEALALTRDQRRSIQSDLTTLGFDTRGVDGIFGPGTRRAIANWQQENGFAQTTYLTAEQISRLDAQAARRAAEIAAEQERQRQEALRLDRAYWEETGARGDEAGLRAYLGRYPQGIFAEVARARLERIEEERRRTEAEADRAAWNSARRTDTVAAYRAYLRQFPQGTYRADAERRIAEIERPVTPPPPPADDNAARAAEEALGLNALTARMVESRLAALGLDPGEVDGRFDNRTRAAIRRYQQQNGLAVTGYLDEFTVLQLVTGALQD
jgi:peptidoglycan hydrolase-like protein with peptidoglycan-binding domain